MSQCDLSSRPGFSPDRIVADETCPTFLADPLLVFPAMAAAALLAFSAGCTAGLAVASKWRRSTVVAKSEEITDAVYEDEVGSVALEALAPPSDFESSDQETDADEVPGKGSGSEDSSTGGRDPGCDGDVDRPDINEGSHSNLEEYTGSLDTTKDETQDADLLSETLSDERKVKHWLRQLRRNQEIR